MLIPKENEKDLAEIPDNVKNGLKIVPVSSMRPRCSRLRWCASPRRSIGRDRKAVPRVALDEGRSGPARHPLSPSKGPDRTRFGPFFYKKSSGFRGFWAWRARGPQP